ncbi:MAG: threonine/serine exporter family protein [Eubacteriales bacterium]|nr:threonine/serine exporter family protein [Eubacteriales bacterium]
MKDILIKSFIDIGEAMLECGSEVYRTEDSIHRMCKAYGAVHCDVYALTNIIQVTVQTPEDDIITQIRYVRGNSTNFDRLIRLNSLCRFITAERPSQPEISRRFQEIMNLPDPPRWRRFLAAAMIMGGFTVFFGGTLVDGAIGAAIGLLIALLDIFLGKVENNEFVYNFEMAFVIGAAALGAWNVFPVLKPGMIIVGSIMLLISALGFTNGIRCIFRGNFMSGSVKMLHALVGAFAIASGIAVAMMLISYPTHFSTHVNANNAVYQLLSTTIGCMGLLIWQKLRGVRVIACAGLGAFLAWGTELIAMQYGASAFYATMIASVFTAFFSDIMARWNRMPATIFLTSCMFALIPGANLYNFMNGILVRDSAFALSNCVTMLKIALAIALGFIVMNIIKKYVLMIQKLLRGEKIPDPKHTPWL